MLNYYRYHGGQFQITLNEIVFSGDDVKDFLQNQSTYNIDLLTEKSFQLISFLDPQGRVEGYGWLLFKNSQYRFLVPKLITERTVSRLNRFLISEDVYLTEPVKKSFTVLIGPEAQSESGYKGNIFDEEAYIQDGPSELKTISEQDIELWRGFTGFPKFDGSDFSHEILNNLRLFDLTLAQSKGCYPGQETVSKIATRRGAAYSPVLLELSAPIASFGEITSFDKKIGKATGCYEWEGKFYLASDLLRDFRVEKLKVHFTLDGKEHDGIVRYYPLLSGDPKLKARELYYEATDHFRLEELDKSEEKFRQAIKLDPGFADAYESFGVMLGRQERFLEAIELMEALVKVDPKSVLAHTNLSLFLMRTGKIAEAEEHKSLATVKSFQSFGDEAKNKEAEKSRKEKQLQEWAQRESMFKQVLEIDPDDTLANYGIGSIAVEKGEWDIARSHLENVLKQDPKYSVAYLALGRALKGLGRLEEAKAIWQEGVKVSAAKGDLMPANQMQQELSL